MKKSLTITLTVILLILLFLSAAGIFFYMWKERTKLDDKTKDSSSLMDIFNKAKDIGGDVQIGTDYKILYGKSNNTITASGGADTECKNFTMSEYLGGGIVDRDGSDNVNLDLGEHPTSYPKSKYNNNFFYIEADDNPKSEIMGTVILDWDYDDQSLYSSDFKNQTQDKLISSTDTKFPGNLQVSPDNKYLVYAMTDKTQEKFGGNRFNEEARDSDLVILNNSTGEEIKVLEGEYNRQLFDSFLDFSRNEDALFTIKREEDSYKFVKVFMDTGKVLEFDHVFPGFDWTKVKWDQFFGGEYTGFPTHFYLSPDESKLLAYENLQGEAGDNPCAPAVNHNIWSFNISDDTVEKYDEGGGMVTDLSWKNNSREFVFATVSKGGCYPGYLDSAITKMRREGQNDGVMVIESESKIINLGYSPDGKEVVYDVYGTDFTSYLKSLNPETKEIKEIISTKDTEEFIDQEKPVTLIFMDWVKVE
ncbi:MAG: hypothetical protein HQ538_01040 [Parcubacteria group bacterium]|nr:hypothetical protein [Parcubacteria group bacterium]